MDITKEDDFQFLTENALKNIAIKGRPYPVRDQKLIMQGEDEAYIREAILEREYMVNGPSIGNAPVEVINKSDERILRIPKTWDGIKSDIDKLIVDELEVGHNVWADAHKLDAMEDEVPIDELKASGEDGDNYSEYRFLCRAEFTPDEEVMPDFLARWDAEEDDYRERLAQINKDESDKIKEYQDQLEAKVKELKTQLNEAIQEMQKQYENEVREAHIEMLTALQPIAEKWNTIYIKSVSDSEDFPSEAHTEYLIAKAGLLDTERKTNEDAKEGLENAIKEANDKYNQDYNTWKTWTEDVIYSVRVSRFQKRSFLR